MSKSASSSFSSYSTDSTPFASPWATPSDSNTPFDSPISTPGNSPLLKPTKPLPTSQDIKMILSDVDG